MDTAYRDILDLMERGVLKKNPGGGRSTSYDLAGFRALAGFEEVDLEHFKVTWLWGLMTASGTKPA